MVDWVTLRQGQLLTANLAIYIYTGHPVAPPLFVYSASHDAYPALISAIRLASRLFSLEESFIQLKWVLMALPCDYAANSRSMLLDRIPLDIEEDQAIRRQPQQHQHHQHQTQVLSYIFPATDAVSTERTHFIPTECCLFRPDAGHLRCSGKSL
jgi:hypothetical protein